jgi:hypothetical protein
MYVPAGKTIPPGISTGWLKVTTVFLFHPSAFALDENIKATTLRQMIVTATLIRLIITFFISLPQTVMLDIAVSFHHNARSVNASLGFYAVQYGTFLKDNWGGVTCVDDKVGERCQKCERRV